MASGMMRCFRSIAEAGTTSAVSRSAGASCGCRPIWSVSDREECRGDARDDPLAAGGRGGALARGEALDHPFHRPAESEACAGEGENKFHARTIGRLRPPPVGSAAHAGRDRDRRRGDRHDRGVADRRRRSRGGAPRARRARIGRDRTQPGPGLAARSRGARPAVARERRALRQARRRRASSHSTASRSARCCWQPTRASWPRSTTCRMRASAWTRPGVAAEEPGLAPGMAGGLLIAEGRRSDPGGAGGRRRGRGARRGGRDPRPRRGEAARRGAA